MSEYLLLVNTSTHSTTEKVIKYIPSPLFIEYALVVISWLSFVIRQFMPKA